ncbi:MAG: transcriptional repressor [Aquisalinus sp.]|nr:transcriptional repressor [Aquisalinus sp.]
MAQNIIVEKLVASGIKPTRIRVALATLLLSGKDQHVTADSVVSIARQKGIRTSVASVYNTLNQFADCGLLKRIIVDQGPVFFDTNTDNHYHVYYEDSGKLTDLPAEALQIAGIDEIPRTGKITGVDVIIRVSA